MGQVGSVIANTGNAALWYMERLLEGVEDKDFAVKPRGVDGEIDTNHPAFVLGHLARYPAVMLGALGADAGAVSVPESYEELFSAKAACRSDPDGSIYPGRAELTERFFSSHKHLFGVLAETGDEVLARENPMEGLKDIAPTVGAMADFMVGLHIATHMGQLSAWRRCMGLGSVFRVPDNA